VNDAEDFGVVRGGAKCIVFSENMGDRSWGEKCWVWGRLRFVEARSMGN
jgi:hypothetical protein